MQECKNCSVTARQLAPARATPRLLRLPYLLPVINIGHAVKHHQRQVQGPREKPVALLHARLAADAAAACQLLEGSGLSLCDAVRQLFAAVHAQGVACAPFIPSGGVGAEITALPPCDLQKLFAAARPATPAELKQAARATTVPARRTLAADLTYLRPYIAVCAFAGMRPTECTRLRWQDIDFEDSITRWNN